MTVVITPVDTSLFNNGAQENTTINDTFSVIKDQRANVWADYEDYIEPLRNESQGFIHAMGESASAELQSTQAIRNELNDNITVHLIASDTIASRLAAEILKDELLGLPGVNVEFNEINDVIQGLCATDPNQFEVLGVPILLERLNQICNNLQDDQELAINITGGYAATVPLLTLFAQNNQCPLYYNFEETLSIIEILRYFPLELVVLDS